MIFCQISPSRLSYNYFHIQNDVWNIEYLDKQLLSLHLRGISKVTLYVENIVICTEHSLRIVNIDQSCGDIVNDLFIQCFQQIYIERLLYTKPLSSETVSVNKINKNSAPKSLCSDVAFMALYIYIHLQVLLVQAEGTTVLLTTTLSSKGQCHFIILQETMYISQYFVINAISTMQGQEEY